MTVSVAEPCDNAVRDAYFYTARAAISIAEKATSIARAKDNMYPQPARLRLHAVLSHVSTATATGNTGDKKRREC